MDKKILIALGLISAFSINGASGMENWGNSIRDIFKYDYGGSIDEYFEHKASYAIVGHRLNLSPNEYCRLSLMPMKKLFHDNNYGSLENWKIALDSVRATVLEYSTNQQIPRILCLPVLFDLLRHQGFLYSFLSCNLSDQLTEQTLCTLFDFIPDILGDAVDQSYIDFVSEIKRSDLKTAVKNADYSATINQLHQLF